MLWQYFGCQVRKITVYTCESPYQALKSPPEGFFVGTEAGISAQVVENIFTQLEQVFGIQDLLMRFADRAMGSFAVNGMEPDAIIQGVLKKWKRSGRWGAGDSMNNNRLVQSCYQEQSSW